MATATLNSNSILTASVSVPAWGAWYAEVTLDAEVTLAPGAAATLVISDATFVGAVLSGGAWKGRSMYRVVGGRGKWGDNVPKRGYADDAGVKTADVLRDAAGDAGENLEEASLPGTRIAAAWVREAGQARQTLELVAPRGWYIGEDGITRIGARTPTTYNGTAPRERTDLARGIIVLASDTIAVLRPGITVDGVVAIDVQHEVSKKGVRTTIYGKGLAESGRLAAMQDLIRALFPRLDYMAPVEYRVESLAGKRLMLQPVRASSGKPDLARVPVRPGISGARCEPDLGSRVLVSFTEGDPARPSVTSFEEADADGFSPDLLSLEAGGMVGGEHVMTAEATALLIYNTLVALMAAAGGGPLLAAVLQPLLGAAVTAAISAQAAPAPPGLVAQTAAAAALQAGFAAGTTPSPAMFAAWTSALAALATKTPNVSGSFPSVGSAAVKAG